MATSGFDFLWIEMQHSALDYQDVAVNLDGVSMGPKIEAAINFLEQGGKQVLITAVASLSSALRGKSGTVVTGALNQGKSTEGG